MYKTASRRTGGQSLYGYADLLAKWRSRDRTRKEPEPFARYILGRAARKGGAEHFTKSLTDAWLAELIRQFIQHGLIPPTFTTVEWPSIETRLAEAGLRMTLKAGERAELEALAIAKMNYWRDGRMHYPNVFDGDGQTS